MEIPIISTEVSPRTFKLGILVIVVAFFLILLNRGGLTGYSLGYAIGYALGMVFFDLLISLFLWWVVQFLFKPGRKPERRKFALATVIVLALIEVLSKA